MLVFIAAVAILFWTELRFPGSSFAQEGGAEVSEPFPSPSPVEEQEPSDVQVITYATPVREVGVTPIPPTPEPQSDVAQRALHYVAEKYDLPLERLLILAEEERVYPVLGRSFLYVQVYDRVPDNRSVIELLVDSEDGTVMEDVQAVEQAEAEAHRERYGKLDPALYEHLQGVLPTESVPVVIWTINEQESPVELQARISSILAERYPEAREALEDGRVVMDVEDQELSEQIHREWVSLIDGAQNEHVQALIEAIRSLGFEPQFTPGSPAVYVTLPVEVIQLLSARSDIGVFYLDEEGEAVNQSEDATASSRIQSQWDVGFDGTGVRVAVLEFGNVDTTSPTNTGECRVGNNCFTHVPVPRLQGTGATGDDNHATTVAAVIASNHERLRGMSPGAQIISAGIAVPGTTSGHSDALLWALDQQSAHVVNASYGLCYPSSPGTMKALDHVFDYYSWTRRRLIVKSAGNIQPTGDCANNYVTTPGKGWNVLTVGSYNDGDNSNWSGDTMDSLTQWQDSPSSSQPDKPEVAAPGVHIATLGQNGASVNANPNGAEGGTSVAAAQVSGLAAVLMDRASNLISYPEATRAIIIASAVHNIEGPSNAPPGVDASNRDGAGGINGNLAGMAASHQVSLSACAHSCWMTRLFSSTSFDANNDYLRSFHAVAGERVRVAIAWQSSGSCTTTSSCTVSLPMKLDLYIDDPDLLLVDNGSSASGANSYELVEFTARKTGTYRIRIHRAIGSSTGEGERVGIAIVKDATYVPELRNEGIGGWNSRLYIRNDGPLTRAVDVHYLAGDGSRIFVGGDFGYFDRCTLGPNQSCDIAMPERFGTTPRGSAVLNGGEDISVVAINEHGSTGSNPKSSALEGVPAGSDRSGIGPGTVLYVPSYRWGRYGYYTDLWIQNLAGVTNYVDIYYYDGNGVLNQTVRSELSAGGTNHVQFQSALQFGAARIVAGYPVTARIDHIQPSDTRALSYPAVNTRASATLAHFPSLQREYYGSSSSLQFQETAGFGSSTHTLSLLNSFFESNGSLTYYDPNNYNIAPRGSRELVLATSTPLPTGWLGSGISSRTSQGGEFATAVHHINNAYTGMGYTGVVHGGRDLILPHISHKPDWRSAFTVQNLEDRTVSIMVYIYDGAGNHILTTYPSGGLAPRERFSVYGQLPQNFNGSAWIRADGRVTAVVHTNRFPAAPDTAWGYRALVK